MFVHQNLVNSRVISKTYIQLSIKLPPNRSEHIIVPKKLYNPICFVQFIFISDILINKDIYFVGWEGAGRLFAISLAFTHSFIFSKCNSLISLNTNLALMCGLSQRAAVLLWWLTDMYAFVEHQCVQLQCKTFFILNAFKSSTGQHNNPLNLKSELPPDIFKLRFLLV